MHLSCFTRILCFVFIVDADDIIILLSIGQRKKYIVNTLTPTAH